jgi:hypothetical protein
MVVRDIDNYSWLDSCFKLIKGNYEYSEAKQTIISQMEKEIEIEKLRARIEETTLWCKEWGNGKDVIGDGSWEDYYEHRVTHLTEKLKELEG